MASQTSSTAVSKNTRKKERITTPPKPRRACDCRKMRLIVVSGLSGSGKSVALHMLEDIGFYCIDNIPAALLKPFIAHTVRSAEKLYERTAVGLDARNTAAELATIPALI